MKAIDTVAMNLEAVAAAAIVFGRYLSAAGLCQPEVFGQVVWLARSVYATATGEVLPDAVAENIAFCAVVGEVSMLADGTIDKVAFEAFKADVAAHLAEDNCHNRAVDLRKTSPPQLGSDALDWV